MAKGTKVRMPLYKHVTNLVFLNLHMKQSHLNDGAQVNPQKLHDVLTQSGPRSATTYIIYTTVVF